MDRSGARIWLFVALAMASAVAGASVVVTVTADDPDPLRWAALGDSFTSGEGNPPYDESAPCTRSAADAYPLYASRQLRDTGTDVEVTFRACSGAVAADIAGQLASVDGPVDVVTLTIGGNDAGFAEIVVACLGTGVVPLPFPVVDPCLLDDADWSRRITAVRSAVAAALRHVSTEAPDAAVILVGYPSPVPVDGRCALFGPGETATAARIAVDLDAALADAAREAGARYVSVLDRFAGHDACADDPWMRGLDADRTRDLDSTFSGSFHPNLAGHEAYADIVAAILRTCC